MSIWKDNKKRKIKNVRIFKKYYKYYEEIISCGKSNIDIDFSNQRLFINCGEYDWRKFDGGIYFLFEDDKIKEIYFHDELDIKFVRFKTNKPVGAIKYQ